METKDGTLKYSIHGHRAVILVYMLLVFVVIIFVIPWLIGGIERLYVEKMPGWSDSVENVSSDISSDENQEVQEKTIEAKFDKNGLSNFLGGVVGVLIGFGLDFVFIDRLKHIRKYQSLISVIARELISMHKALKNKKPINEQTIREILLGVDNINIIINVPRYFMCGKKPGRDIYNALANLSNELCAYANNEKGSVSIQDAQGKGVHAVTAYGRVERIMPLWSRKEML